MSAITNNAITSISCPAPYTLVSCGYKTAIVNDLQIRGSYIIDQTCYAMNGASGSSNGVYAFARCCDSTPHSLSCNTYISEFSMGNDDAKVNVTCKNTVETLFGCTAHADAGDVTDGSFPGTFPLNSKGNPKSGTYHSYGNTCSGWMSTEGNEGVRSFGTCCNSTALTFDCLAIISEPTVSSQGATISLSCPQQHFMTGCSATSPWHEENQWFVTNSSQCIVRNGGGHDGLKAHAICCKTITFAPTMNPTFYPTLNPITFNPTINPTSNPTMHPTSIPTIAPTLNPSNIPTSNPSNAPTKSPTKTPVHSGEIDIITTSIINTNDALKSNENANNFMIKLFISIIAGLTVIVFCLCVVFCCRKKRYNQKEFLKQTNSLQKITSVSTNTTNMNSNTNNGEDQSNINLTTTSPMPAVTPTNGIILKEGDTEMISLPPINNVNGIGNESDDSQSVGLYDKKQTQTAGNTVMNVTTSNDDTCMDDNNDNDINLMDGDNEHIEDNNDNSDTDGNDKLYMSGDGVTTKGDL